MICTRARPPLHLHPYLLFRIIIMLGEFSASSRIAEARERLEAATAPSWMCFYR